MSLDGDDIKDVLASTGNDGSNTGPKRIFCLNGLDGEAIWDTYTDGPNFSVIELVDWDRIFQIGRLGPYFSVIGFLKWDIL